jgi:galactosamine-6-phosphate isomerase
MRCTLQPTQTFNNTTKFAKDQLQLQFIMKVSYYNNYQDMSQQASQIILAALEARPNLMLCAATGGSPTGTYQLLATAFSTQPNLFEQLRLFKLDEWVGLSMTHPQSCEAYLRKHLIAPLRISEDRYFSFYSQPEHPLIECQKMAKTLEQQGPIDICVLGIGVNGHIGLNEPAATLHPNCHVASLSVSTLSHPMIQALETLPTHGLTVGVGDILKAKKVILLIAGQHKKEATEQLLRQQITTQLPASLLWLHNDVECLIDKAAMQA